MIEVDRFTKLRVEEYNGTFSIIQGYENREGKFSPTFIKREFGKEKTVKTAPLSLKIGTRDTAKDTLVAIYREIYGDEDMPF